MPALPFARSRALLAAHTSHIYRVHHAQLLSWRQFEPGRGGPRSGGSGSGGGGGGPGPPGAAATLAGGPAGGSGAPLSFLAQLRPRDGGGGGGGGGQEAPVLGAVSVTRERLTVGGTLQLPVRQGGGGGWRSRRKGTACGFHGLMEDIYYASAWAAAPVLPFYGLE